MNMIAYDTEKNRLNALFCYQIFKAGNYYIFILIRF